MMEMGETEKKRGHKYRQTRPKYRDQQGDHTASEDEFLSGGSDDLVPDPDRVAETKPPVVRLEINVIHAFEMIKKVRTEKENVSQNEGKRYGREEAFPSDADMTP